MSGRRDTRFVGVVALGVVVAGCLTQEAPEREPLAPIDQVVSQPLPCSIVYGDSLGVRVDTVVAGGPSDGALVVGDRLASIAGSPVRTLGDVREAMSAVTAGEPVTVDVERGDRQTEETVVTDSAPGSDTPRLGITISEIYDEVPVGEIEDESPEGPFARVVQFGEDYVRLDPLGPTVGPLEAEIPDSPFWHAVGGTIYWVDDPSGSAMLRSSDGDVLDAWEETATPARLLGTIEGDLMVVFLDSGGVSVRRVDPAADDAEWTTRPNTDIGLPVITYAAPDGSRLLLGMGTTDSEELRYLLLEAGSGAILAELEDLRAAATYGWFDDERLVIQVAEDPLSLYTIVDGAIEVVELPTFTSTSVRLWPVGDGRHLLADTGGQLLRSAVGDPSATRPLAARCEVGDVGQLGSGS